MLVVDLRMIFAAIILSFVIVTGTIWAALTFAYSHNGIDEPSTRVLQDAATIVVIGIGVWTVVVLVAVLIERASSKFGRQRKPSPTTEPETSEQPAREVDR